ncbi:hypothetical protein MD484_g6896, partial [Candolleomyces efflorescens]
MNALQASPWSCCPDEVLNHILGYLCMTQLVLLGATSRHNYSLAKLQVRDRVRTFRERWCLPRNFLMFMHRQHMIISGPGILPLIQPDSNAPLALDIYVPKGLHSTVHSYLKENTEYIKFEKSYTFPSMVAKLAPDSGPAGISVNARHQSTCSP